MFAMQQEYFGTYCWYIIFNAEPPGTIVRNFEQFAIRSLPAWHTVPSQIAPPSAIYLPLPIWQSMKHNTNIRTESFQFSSFFQKLNILQIYFTLKKIVFWSATTGMWHHLPVSVSENISHGGRRGSGFEFEYTRRHKRRVFIFTKLHAKSTNARGEYFGIKYCQTVPFPPSN